MKTYQNLSYIKNNGECVEIYIIQDNDIDVAYTKIKPKHLTKTFSKNYSDSKIVKNYIKNLNQITSC
jgi:hypothetical protein